MKVRNADSVLLVTCFSKKYTNSVPATKGVMHSRNLSRRMLAAVALDVCFLHLLNNIKNREYEKGKKLNALVPKCFKLHEKL
jgi:acyl carrier protein phosphodiesterase